MAPSTSCWALANVAVLVTSIPDRDVNAPLVPPVIRSSEIDKVIWSLVVTFAPTWNTPPPVVVVVADVAVTNGMLAPIAVVVSFAPVV